MTYLDIKLKASDMNSYALKDFLGKKLILYFYPKDNTSGCTLEAQEFTRLKKEYNDLGYVIIGVSKDSVKSHCSFIEKQSLDILLLSDPDGLLLDEFHVFVEKSMYGRKYMGIERSTFVIDETGKIVHEFRNVKAGDHPSTLLSQLK